jgi:hypothetical protein
MTKELFPRPLRHSPRQASQLKSRICLTILAVMPGVDYVSADEGIGVAKMSRTSTYYLFSRVNDLTLLTGDDNTLVQGVIIPKHFLEYSVLTGGSANSTLGFRSSTTS